LLFTTDDTIAELSIELASKQANLEQLALQLSKRRNACSKPFEEQVAALLAQVGMPHAQLKISIKASHELHATGKDDLQFLFAANKGSEFHDLGKVASGGELSRLMLCLKTIVANKAQLPTLIFDEIDTGISGEVARKVGVLLQQLASTHQIICITHLPQIAARGESHYFVYKHTNTERTSTHVKLLTTEERIEEIAKMLSGEPPGTAALANAKELLMEV
jgi:DNA repair protein RecN (Recombination protein N)